MTRVLRAIVAVLLLLAVVFACDALLGRDSLDRAGADAVWRREGGR